MSAYSELEIVIQRDSQGQFMASAEITAGGLNADEMSDKVAATAIRLDLEDEAHFSDVPAECGLALYKLLFSPDELSNALTTARANATARNCSLRVRLRIDPSADELHGLRWETLAAPVAGSQDVKRLLYSDKVIFSRYLYSKTLRMHRMRAMKDIRALVVVANPDGLGAAFEAIDAEKYVALVTDAMQSLHVTALASGGTATEDAIVKGLKNADILFLVCHGVLGDDGPLLWLEKDDGTCDLVDGGQLAERIGGLERPPSLVVLSSCQSAGTGTPGSGALTALGPLLAAQGVAAVLAMQGNFGMNTAEAFMPRFFEELMEHGEVDRAVARARFDIMGEPDWWMPVVFTRLDKSRIWYPPGFRKATDGQDPWEPIVRNIKMKQYTPILGPSVAENIYGTHRELAQLWANDYKYPLNERDIEELPQVAQYLAVIQGDDLFPRYAFYKHVYQRLVDNYPKFLTLELCTLKDDQILKRLGEVISTVGGEMRFLDPYEPHAVLASYDLPVYITSDPSDLLVDALVACKVKPRVRVLRWNQAAEDVDNGYIKEERDAAAAAKKEAVTKAKLAAAAKAKLEAVIEAGRDGTAEAKQLAIAQAEKAAAAKTLQEAIDDTPTSARPLVIKLFGDLRTPGSLVMTEDEYFDYLTKVTASAFAMPSALRSQLTLTPLLFVGFQAETWEFRVLLRSLFQNEGKDLKINRPHFAVQINPNSIVEPARARAYIENYLHVKSKLKLYWGDVATFVKDLKQRTDL